MARQVVPDLAIEAAAILRRLHDIADELGMGFDYPSLAQMALDSLEAGMPVGRSAVFSGYDGLPAVPLAVRGASRPPWPAPSDPQSLFAPLWKDGTPVNTRWESPSGPLNVAAVELREPRGERVGLIVADRPADQPFSDAEMEAMATVATSCSALIDAGMLFGWLRSRSGAQERSRLAHMIHNGIAQDLVALGFEVDAMRLAPAAVPVLPRLDELRAGITRMLTDMRVRIAELKVDSRPDTSVGALILSRLQVVAAYTGVHAGISLRESGIRLPAHVEALLYRLALDVTADAGKSTDTTRIWLDLEVSSPHVQMTIGHDGAESRFNREGGSVRALEALGAIVSMRDPDTGPGLTVEVRHTHVEEPADAVPELGGVLRSAAAGGTLEP